MYLKISGVQYVSTDTDVVVLWVDDKRPLSSEDSATLGRLFPHLEPEVNRLLGWEYVVANMKLYDDK